MLFSKYSSPLVLLDKMIATRRLSEFVNEFIKIRNEDTEGQTAWEFWLHKVYDMTYKEFTSRMNDRNECEERPSQEVLEATVNKSWGIINSFCPS